MSLFFLIPGGQATGAFNLDLGANDAFTSIDENLQTVTGTLSVNTNGQVLWTGDTLGTSESLGKWWSPINTVTGTWHVQLAFTSGTNQYVSGDGLGSWVALTVGRTWNFSKASAGGPDSTNGVYLLSFSDDAGSTTFGSVSINDITLTEQSP